ncbi:MAG: chloride channel protein [Nitrospinota bacterium]
MVGIIGGLGAWFFRMLIGIIHNLSFLGKFSFLYDANQHTPESPWGIWIILVPVAGAFGVAWLVKNFAPETKGHGVPEVMDAIHYGEGRIRPIVAVVKSLASGLCIGSGGSVGREGPIVQIGAAFGSMLGQWSHLPAHQRITLIAAGAASGIAATFNTPLGGLVFSFELMLLSINAANILPVTIATVTATAIGRLLLGLAPAFDILALRLPDLHLVQPWGLILFFPFGVLMGLWSVLFVRGIYWAEDRFDSLPGNYYTRHALGMAFVGLVIYLLQLFSGHYYVQGVGYATIVDVLNGPLSDPLFLLLLFAVKLLVTGLTLGSGGSGGIFSPSLFMGTVLGAAYGQISLGLFPELLIGPSTFVVSGMAAAIGGSTGAVMTAIVMIFEMTLDYNAILPIMISATTAYAVRKAICRESIYTLKPFRRGHVIPEGLEAAVLSSRRVSEVMGKTFSILAPEKEQQQEYGINILAREGTIIGPVYHVPSAIHERAKAESLVTDRYIIVPPNAGLVETLRTLKTKGAEFALISTNPGSRKTEDLVGVLTAREIAEAIQRTAELL